MFYDQHADIYEVITHAYDDWLEFFFKKNNETLKQESLDLMNRSDFVSMMDPRKFLDIYSSHSILYILGIVFFIAIVVLEEVFGLMTYTGKAIALMFSIDTSHERVKQMIQMKAD
jgi:hypothetical protein